MIFFPLPPPLQQMAVCPFRNGLAKGLWSGDMNVLMCSFAARMTNACHRKCVPPHYKEADLTKGESVCLDRCVAKYLDLHERLGRKLTELSVQDEELMRKAAVGSG